MKPITTKLVGVTFGDRQENIRKFGCEAIGSYAMVREPENPHDPNAIRVAVGKFTMGYVPSKLAMELAPLMDAGMNLMAFFVKLNVPLYDGPVGLTLEIREVPAMDQPDQRDQEIPEMGVLPF